MVIIPDGWTNKRRVRERCIIIIGAATIHLTWMIQHLCWYSEKGVANIYGNIFFHLHISVLFRLL